MNELWPRFGSVLVHSVGSQLTCGHVKACLRLRFGKQVLTAQVVSFHALCGPDEHVWCGPDLGQDSFAILDGTASLMNIEL